MNLITLSIKKYDNYWFATITNINREIIRSGFSPNKEALLKEISRYLPNTSKIKCNSPEGHRAIKVLAKLFRGKNDNIPLRTNFDYVTTFQQSVYTILRKIPRSKVTTYAMVAEALGCGRGYRAVGNCIASNPLPLIIPCHRVVLSSLELGGYSIPSLERERAQKLKGMILLREGVKFDERRVSASSLFRPSPLAV